ncbi:PREDICTED: cell wall / vacuolar inhibitor of fructosidase 1-like [Camelina sativa]|uniref:Cell wall / vacuolar inhibitor of fructosidase 1-like n=1 Tax=Camelina sativa TaxID=90675 RepID=A0ABM0VV99_CAMSA|nr:PREDICTED: cell wall / vacuolar inhibitor of fructosidase 1-like [Camelina sativa]
MKLIVMVMTMMMISEGSMIDQTCKQTPDFKLCVSLLNSDPRGSSADTSGLALILIDKIKVLATKTLTEINGLYKKRPELKQALDQCSRRYKTILNADVPEAIEAISKGVPKFGEDGVMDAGVEASACEEGFQGKSPLTSLTKSMQNISSVTRAVVRMLL